MKKIPGIDHLQAIEKSNSFVSGNTYPESFTLGNNTYMIDRLAIKKVTQGGRIPASPPVILPVPNGVKRPLWSVMIPAYNCSAYLIETIRSVLQQDPGVDKMQIEVVDDCSTDTNVEALVQYIGKGRVGYYRQPENVGSLRNFETCINRSKGQFIHLLHGDDVVKPGFYSEIKNVFTQFPEAGAAFTGYTYIAEHGAPLYQNDRLLDKPAILKNWLLKIGSAQYIQPPSIVVRRSVYEHLGGFFAVHYGEDWEMWVRIASHYPIAHSPKMLALYRVHGNNITSRYFLSGQGIKDIEKVINIIQNYLPKNKRSALRSKAKNHFSKYFAKCSDRIYHEYHNPARALANAKLAFDMDVNLFTVYFLLKIHAKRFLRYKMGSEAAPAYRILNYFR